MATSEADKQKKILPAAEVDKAIKKLIKDAVIQITRDDGIAMPGCFVRKTIALKPAQLTNISHSALINIISAKVPTTPDCIVKVCDAFITTYSSDVFLKFMNAASLRTTGDYIAEQFDCDDYSVVFCSAAHKWHARIRANLEGNAALKRLLPNVPPSAQASSSLAPARIIAHPRDDVNDSQYLGGSPIGICHGKLSATSGEHAFNFWITPESEIVFIEPQTYEYITFGDGASIDFIYI
jgi:hypothetical protein